MVKITIKQRSPDVVMEIVRQLRASGVVQGKHFDFAYHQSKWDAMIGEIPNHTVFTFYTEKYAKYATLIALKYS